MIGRNMSRIEYWRYMAEMERLNTQLEETQAELAAVMTLLSDVHDLMDESNNVYSGTYCQWCRGGQGYDGDGLLHEDDCVLRVIRQFMC